MRAQFFTQWMGFSFPVVVDGLLQKCVGEERFSQPRFQEKLPIFRAMYQNPRLSSRHLVVLITEAPCGGLSVASVMEDMETYHLLPATYADLLYFASTYREKVDRPIMAFGTKIYESEDLYTVPCADGNGGDKDKSFYLNPVEKDASFGGGWAYLAYPKPGADIPISTGKG